MKRRNLLLAVIIIFCSVISGIIGFGVTYFNGDIKNIKLKMESRPETADKNISGTPKVTIPKTKVVKEAVNKETADLSDVVDKVMPSVVAITAEGEQEVNTWFGTEKTKVKNMGSGVIMDKDRENIYVITNNHVVNVAKNLMITFSDNTTVAGKVKNAAAFADIALVSVKLSDIKEKTLRNIKIAKLGNSDNIKVGQMVLAIGNALGYGQSTTVGYISAKDRKVTNNNITMNLLQTDAAINKGNSGGALLNLKGEVIGINSAKFSGEAVEGMGYAIPVSAVEPLINELKNTARPAENERGYLGIYYKEVDTATHDYFNMPYGLYILEFAKNGGAEKAGLRKGDIIIKVNGYETLKAGTINSIIINKRKGEKVKVTILRYADGKYKEKVVDVVLAERPKKNK